MNEIIKEFRKKFVCKWGDKNYEQSIEIFNKKGIEKLEKFILTKLKEERIKTLEEIPRNGIIPPRDDYDSGYNQKCREISDYIINEKTKMLKDKMNTFNNLKN